MTQFFTIQLIDIYGNMRTSSINGTDVYIMAEYVNHNSWGSPIGIPDISNWIEIYGQDIAGIAEDNNDGTYTG